MLQQEEQLRASYLQQPFISSEHPATPLYHHHQQPPDERSLLLHRRGEEKEKEDHNDDDDRENSHPPPQQQQHSPITTTSLLSSMFGEYQNQQQHQHHTHNNNNMMLLDFSARRSENTLVDVRPLDQNHHHHPHHPLPSPTSTSPWSAVATASSPLVSSIWHHLGLERESIEKDEEQQQGHDGSTRSLHHVDDDDDKNYASILAHRKNHHDAFDNHDRTNLLQEGESSSFFGLASQRHHQQQLPPPETTIPTPHAGSPKALFHRKSPYHPRALSLRWWYSVLEQMAAIITLSILILMTSIPSGVAYFPTGWSNHGHHSDSSDGVIHDENDIQGVFPLPGKEALGIRMALFATLMGQLVMTFASGFDNIICFQLLENIPFYHVSNETMRYGKGTGTTQPFYDGTLATQHSKAQHNHAQYSWRRLSLFDTDRPWLIP